MPTLLSLDRRVVNSGGDFVDRDRENLFPALEGPAADLGAHVQQLWNDMNAMRTYLLHHQPTTVHQANPDRQGAIEHAVTAFVMDGSGWVTRDAAVDVSDSGST